jgi:hypothetical protein
MKPGAGPRKGSAFERACNTQMSLWVTNGKRADIFSRNIISGGRFTNQLRKGGELGTPGDMAGVLPEAHKFLSLFTVEYKHHREIRLEHYILDRKGTSFLHKTIVHTRDQASQVGRHYLVIAKENHRPILMFADPRVIAKARSCSMPKHPLHYHLLHDETVAMVEWESFMRTVYIDRFLNMMRERS